MKLLPWRKAPTFLPSSELETNLSWDHEELYFSGNQYFSDVAGEIERASCSIEVETYIFSNDSLGEMIAQALISAANRGVGVRLIVDAIGSPSWRESFEARFREARIQFHIHHEPPWEAWLKKKEPGARRKSIRDWLRRLNTRNHRKLFIIDKRTAFVGGMNVWDVHLESVYGSQAWRDTGVKVIGEGLKAISASFELHWTKARSRISRYLPLAKQRSLKLVQPLVLINSWRYLRKRTYRELLNRIENSKKRLWITTAYFVPTGALLEALNRVARRGVDVRVIVPAKSDIFFMPWISSVFYKKLLMAGVKIFEYQTRVLHAKSILGDNWAILGSSNMNHRSILHDLEIDVVLNSNRSLESLEAQFLTDQGESQELAMENIPSRSLWVRLIGRIMFFFRVFL